MKLRIQYVHWNADLYGASRSLLRLTTRLVQDGHQARVLLGGDGPLVARLQAAGVEVECFPRMAAIERDCFRSLRGLLDLAGRMRATRNHLVGLLRDWQPDVLHSNTSILAADAKAARACGIPHVWHLRESFLEFPALWKVYRPFMERGADRIICISDSVANQFAGGARHPKVDCIANGLPRDEITPPTHEERQQARASIGLPPHTVTVTVAGRIKLFRKGQETLIEAAALLNRFSDVRFLIVGTPYPGNESHVTRLRALAEQRGVADRVVFAGERAESAAVMALTDILVVPSRVPEPFGNVTLEAMAAGLPVVGSAIGGTAELIEDEATGRLFPPGDAGALSRCLAELLDDPVLRDRMGQRGRARFLEHFTLDQTYEHMLRVYRSLLP